MRVAIVDVEMGSQHDPGSPGIKYIGQLMREWYLGHHFLLVDLRGKIIFRVRGGGGGEKKINEKGFENDQITSKLFF